MKKYITGSLIIALITMSFTAHAELPTPSTYKKTFQVQQQYPNGYNQFGYPQQQYGAYGYGQPTQSDNYAKLQSTYNKIMIGKDLLWVFTGNESTFGKRLFYMFSGVLDRKFVQPIENKLGSLEYGRQMGAQAAYQNPYAQQGAACYDCIQQNATNPYQQNPQAIDKAIFGGANTNAGGIKQ